MDSSRVRLQHLRSDPRLSLTVLAADDWYTHVSMVGRITEFADDPDLEGIDRLSRHYLDQPYSNRRSPRVNAWMTVDRWHGWGEMRSGV